MLESVDKVVVVVVAESPDRIDGDATSVTDDTVSTAVPDIVVAIVVAAVVAVAVSVSVAGMVC